MAAVLPVLRALVTMIAALGLVDALAYAAFPHFDRLRYNFSSAYLARELNGLRQGSPIIVLGDSVLWGFGVDHAQAAVARIAEHEPAWHNLAYAGGSPVNTLAMLRLLLAAGVPVRRVVFNVNQKQFNARDSAYSTLHPAVGALAYALLDGRERRWLAAVPPATVDARIDRWLSAGWHVYGMRDDVRDALFGTTDAAHALEDVVQRASGARATLAALHRPTPERFEGTYDLTPLGRDNVALAALRDIGRLVRSHHLAALAILTPTNHALLHDYIDVPEYANNLAYVRRLLESFGVRVLDLDAAFPARDFIDNDHLTAAGNARLAAILERAAPP